MTPWPTDGLRRASVNSFGYGGSNAHCVLDDTFNYLKLRGIKARHCTARLPQKEILSRTRVSELPKIEHYLNGIMPALSKVCNDLSDLHFFFLVPVRGARLV